MVGTQRDKAEDAKTKSALDRLKIAFEDYYGDHNCYPPSDWFDSTADCGSNYLTPYLSAIPCDPTTNRPYVVEYDSSGCTSFKIYANLRDDNDPTIKSLCQAGGSTSANYGVSSANTTIAIDCEALGHAPAPTASPVPLPNVIGGNWACTPQGACNNYASSPTLSSCPLTFGNSSDCLHYCSGDSTPYNWLCPSRP